MREEKIWGRGFCHSFIYGEKRRPSFSASGINDPQALEGKEGRRAVAHIARRRRKFPTFPTPAAREQTEEETFERIKASGRERGPFPSRKC